MAVTASVDAAHYSCVGPGPKTTALIAILIARHLPMRFFFFVAFFHFLSESVMERIGEIGRCLGSGGGPPPP